jgi:crotonobetainyl-CoA:carnitine CoA-transferase CaiB-like acyl-CoA transferase
MTTSQAAFTGAPARPGPLSGITVVDLTSVVFGPYATQIFADLGANVIKVEGPDGDSTRQVGPAHESGMGGTYMNLNRGKRGAMLDLKRPAAREALLTLCEKADIFVHNLRPQAIRKLRLHRAAVAERNPQIVYCNCWGFGTSGPYAARAAYDDIIQAASGLVALTEETTGEASYVPSAIVDKVAGLTLAYAAMAALVERNRTGTGSEVEVPMFETMVAFNLTEHASGAIFVPPLGRPVYDRQTSRTRRPFATIDGRISVIVYNDRQWQSFADLVGVPGLMVDPIFRSMGARLANLDKVNGFLAKHFATRTTAEWLALLAAAGVAAMPVNTTADLYSEPHLAAVGMFVNVQDPEFGGLRYPRQPVLFDGAVVAPPVRAPRLGEHTRDILYAAGLSGVEIDAAMANT